MVKGELRDFDLNHSKSKISLKEYLRILSRKTGVLFAATAKVGAIIGGGDDQEVNSLSTYGHNLKHTLSAICEKKISTAKRNLHQLKNSEAKEILIEFTEKIQPHPDG